MVRIVLLFFGAVFLYTGVLVLDRDPTSAITAAVIGILLVVKPVMDGIGFLQAKYFQPHRPGKPREKPRKTHLRVVEPKDKKPTIH